MRIEDRKCCVYVDSNRVVCHRTLLLRMSLFTLVVMGLSMGDGNGGVKGG